MVSVSWTTMRITHAVFAIVAMAVLVSEPRADCGPFTPGRLVKLSVLRCESARPYLEAAAAAKAIKGFGDLAKSSEEKYPGTVMVGTVKWELRLKPALVQPEGSSITAEPQWTRVVENARVWLQGASDLCRETKPNQVVELWVHAPCCDLLPPQSACLADMDIAESLPQFIKTIVATVQQPE